jgi:integrase
VRQKRILSPEQTMRVLARLRDPVLLISQTCLETGARISEVTGLRIQHVDLQLGCVRIEQRHWRGDIDEPKTARSRRTLALGTLRERYRRWMAGLADGSGEGWVFPQQQDGARPMWDSAPRICAFCIPESKGCRSAKHVERRGGDPTSGCDAMPDHGGNRGPAPTGPRLGEGFRGSGQAA